MKKIAGYLILCAILITGCESPDWYEQKKTGVVRRPAAVARDEMEEAPQIKPSKAARMRIEEPLVEEVPDVEKTVSSKKARKGQKVIIEESHTVEQVGGESEAGTFPEPDDSWTYLRVSTQSSANADEDKVTGYVTFDGPEEFRMILYNKNKEQKILLQMSGNRARMFLGGAKRPNFDGELTAKSPVMVQNFSMLREVFYSLSAASAKVGSFAIRYKFAPKKEAEVCTIHIGERSHSRGFPDDFTCVFTKSKLQMTFLVHDQ